MENQFCLGLLVEGGSLHFLDPMTLQSFAAYQFPAYHQLTEYQFVQNTLWAHGRRHLLIVELDYETKQDGKSIFAQRSGIYEPHRSRVIQPEINLKNGLFEKERNIVQALEKNKGIQKENLGKYASHTTIIEGYDCLENAENVDDYGDEEEEEYDPEHDDRRESPEQARARVDRVANRE